MHVKIKPPNSRSEIPMADLKQLEFYLLRYVPYLVKGEFVNIGVLLFEPLPAGYGFADVRMTNDWRRVSRLDREVDIEVLQGLEPYLRTQWQNSQDAGFLLHKLEDSFANMIQISSRQGCLAADPARELDRLGSVYLEEPQREVLPFVNRPKSEHALIFAQIEDAFTRAGVWALGMHHTSAGIYTKKKHDPLFFDFGYVVGTEVRFFQAVPLKTSNQKALVLASRFPKVAECILRETHANALLTAVVADDLDRKHPDIEFALELFEENHVQLATTAEMPSIAERARRDLKA
jgi:hypothetical protein